MLIVQRLLLAIFLALPVAACTPGDPEPTPQDTTVVAPPTPPKPVAVQSSHSAFQLFSDKKDNVRHSVPLADIRKGIRRRDPRDAIPPIYKPTFVAADKAGHLKNSDRVIGVEIGGEARAYPIGVLNRHEIVSDTVGGTALAITYCPLCRSAIAFERRVNGKTLTFGVSGYLYQSDLLMWDHETESFWSQISGHAIAGPMTDTVLERIPVQVTSWKAWRAEFPKTQVLVGPFPAGAYAVNPYGGYETSPQLVFPVKETDARFHPKAVVTGIEIGGVAKAYPHKLLKAADDTILDTVGGQKIEIRYNAANDSCRIFDAKGIELPALTAFWFAWYTFHSDTAVFSPKE